MLNQIVKNKLFRISSLLTIVTGCLLFSLPTQAVEYGGIGGRPAFPREDNPRTESIFVHTLETGSIIEEGVKLVNNSNETKTLLIYATDSEIATGGAFTCKQMSDPQLNVGSWVWLSENEVTLDPVTNKIVPFTISVPENASVGEHNGCIVIQEKKESSEEKQAGMSLTFRTGLRVALTIPGEIIRQIEITSFDIIKNQNKTIFKPKVRNLGNVSIDANISIEVKHLLGLEKNYFGGRYPVLRDESADWNFELKKVFWGGFYKANLTVGYNDQLGIGEYQELDNVVLTYPSVWCFMMPDVRALLIYLLILIALVTGIVLIILNKKRKNWVEKNWVEYKVKAGDDVQKIATEKNASWKELVKVNKLTPPYTLKVGGILKVPPKK